MRTTDLWKYTADETPTQEDRNYMLFGAWVDVHGELKYVRELGFDPQEKRFYEENDWGDRTYTDPTVWMAMPNPAPRKKM